MLFDLRGRGRRRTVQVIYAFLALLLVAGVLGAGIGGGFGGGGLFNAVSSNGGGSGGPADRIKQDQKLVARDPNNASAWATLAHDSYAAAGQAGNYDQVNQVFTAKGRTTLAVASQAWQRYLTLQPNNPDPGLASLMLQAYSGPGALADPASAVRALQIVIASRPPNATLYEDLALLSYQAHNTRVGDLAAAKAVSLVPAARRAILTKQLAQVKKNPTAAAGAAGASPGAATGGSGAPTGP